MSAEKKTTGNALYTIKGVEALMYQRNQAYAFIVIQGLSSDFLKFIKEKQYEQTTDEELKNLLIKYKKRTTNGKC